MRGQEKAAQQEAVGVYTRFELPQAGLWGQHDAAGLRLPPGVDDRAVALAHHVVVPGTTEIINPGTTEIINPVYCTLLSCLWLRTS